MYTPFAHFIVSGELTTLVNTSSIKTPHPTTVFTVALYRPEEQEPDRDYIVFDIGNSDTKGACTILSQLQHGRIHESLKPLENPKTIYAHGDSVSPSDNTTARKDNLASILSTSDKIFVNTGTISTPNRTGAEISLLDDNNNGGKIILTPAQRNYLCTKLYPKLDNNLPIPAHKSFAANPELVVNSAGETKAVPPSQTANRVIADFLNTDSKQT